MEKNCVIFVIKKLYFVSFLDFIWTWTFNLKKSLDCGWTWTEFWKFRTESGSQNMTVRSSLLCYTKHTCVEDDRVSGSRSNPVLQFGNGSDWILKIFTGSDMDIQTRDVAGRKFLSSAFTAPKVSVLCSHHVRICCAFPCPRPHRTTPHFSSFDHPNFCPDSLAN